MKPTQRSTELLEVESDEEREARLERLLASKTGPSSTTGPDLTANFLGEKKTFNVPPPTDLLARLEAFLPEMKKANDDLTQKIAVEGQKSVDIEHLGDDGEPLDEEDGETEASESSQRKPYIVMDLGLGVFEQRPKTSTVPGSVSPPPEDSSDSDTDSSDDDDNTAPAKRPKVRMPSRK